MIRSAVIRLTLLYLGIVMVICVGFSMLLYRTASIELERELQRPPSAQIIKQVMGSDYNTFRTLRLQESHEHLRTNLVLLNLLMLVGSGIISYYAARRTIEPIQSALDAQTRFAADASHELRTPLAAMKTEIEVSLRDGSLKKQEMRGLLESNLEEIGKLQMLSENLLRLARQTEDTLPLRAEHVADIMLPAWQRLDKPAKQKNIGLIDELGDYHVIANRAGLEELSYILLDNAIKYSPEGTNITARSIVHGKTVTIEIEDLGQGIAPDKVNHIFDRFYRADPSRTKTSSGGHGLGLAIAANIAKLHKTDIKVKSRLDAGSTFSISLRKADK